MSALRPHRGRSAGFSLVEILIVIVITTVGFLALINLQVATLNAVGGSRSMMQAVNLAEHFIETLKSEALAWNGDGSELMDSNRFPNLYLVGAATDGGGSGWVQGFKVSGSDKRIGPIGKDTKTPWNNGITNEIDPEVNRQFCVHYQLTWLIPRYLIRADVRVLWMRHNADLSLYRDCGTGSEMERDLANVGSVTIPGTILRNVFAQ